MNAMDVQDKRRGRTFIIGLSAKKFVLGVKVHFNQLLNG